MRSGTRTRASVAAAAAVFLTFACSSISWLPGGKVEGPSDLLGPRPPAPAYVESRFAPGSPKLGFLLVGDTGTANAVLADVSAAMARAARTARVDLVLLLGDNFYEHGVRSVSDPLWQSCFERAFEASELDVPFYAALGNHDHRGSVQAQIDYTRGATRWRMPAAWYSFERELEPGVRVEIFVLDTPPIEDGSRSADEQRRWLEARLSASEARWKILAGHEPVRSSGRHGPARRLAAWLEPLIARHGVDLVLSGHDHDLELARISDTAWQVVAGAGSSTRDMHWGEDTVFAAPEPGFAWVGVDRDELSIEFHGREGPLYAQRIVKSAAVPAGSASRPRAAR